VRKGRLIFFPAEKPVAAGQTAPRNNSKGFQNLLHPAMSGRTRDDGGIAFRTFKRTNHSRQAWECGSNTTPKSVQYRAETNRSIGLVAATLAVKGPGRSNGPEIRRMIFGRP
jgi:hypothetical protein